MTRTLPPLFERWIDTAAHDFLQPPGAPQVDFAHPPGEPALVAPDSVSWQVFKNQVGLFIGGVAAVVLELAEPRVRTGVWEHSSFRTQPLARLQRTGLAAMMSVYGPRSQTEAMIAGVNRRHAAVVGTTPGGQAYRALDTDLLNWVHATASFGFLQAHHLFTRPVSDTERDLYYAESQAAARLFGATGAPRSQTELDALFETMRPRLEPSPIVHEFLGIMCDMPALPRVLRPLQVALVKAAVDITPAWVRERLELDARWGLRPWQRRMVGQVSRVAARVMLPSSPAVQACRRLGLPDNHLYPAKSLAS